MTTLQARRTAEELLQAAGVPDAAADAAWLLCHVMNCERGQLLLLNGQEMDADAQARYFDLIAKRSERIPLQRLTGKAYFMGTELLVKEDVLIPRQDTELLCEKALAVAEKSSCKTVLDMCSGSGAVAVCLAKMTKMTVSAADISKACIGAIGENAAHNGIALEVVQSDLFEKFVDRRFDMITCNPPYVPIADGAEIQSEVRHDPALALYSGADGLDFIRRIAEGVAEYMNNGGTLLMEFGDGQQDAVREIFAGRDIIIYEDMQQLPRVAEIKF